MKFEPKCDHKFVDSTICLKCGWDPYHLMVGHVVQVGFRCMGNDPMVKAVCTAFDHDLAFLLFPNGNYDGFDREELKKVVVCKVGFDEKVEGYRMEGAIQVERDFWNGKFKSVWGLTDEDTCEEASTASRLTYIPCGRPAVVHVYHEKDRRSYKMCFPCADHNVRSRGGKLVGRQIKREEFEGAL
jgi:hypothetical protein